MPPKFSAPSSRLLTLGAVSLALLLAGCGSANLNGAPNVKGLSLPSAEEQLEAHGYKASVTTGALFGVIVRSHYTVCSESTPDEKLVPIKVEKQC
jgi:hypothetical protein